MEFETVSVALNKKNERACDGFFFFFFLDFVKRCFG
jgi:hypothetical protein